MAWPLIPAPSAAQPATPQPPTAPRAGAAAPAAPRAAQPIPVPPIPPNEPPPRETKAEPPAPPTADPAAPPDPNRPKLPRFAALKSDTVNLRAGPGTRYPIQWVYHRRDWPVEIEREFEVWRAIRDADGVRGWVHSATLTARRTVLVIGQDATLRSDRRDTASAVAILRPGVIGRLRACPAGSDWCEVRVGSHRGYLRREQVWGLYPNEEVKP